jgi:hypothetical protein
MNYKDKITQYETTKNVIEYRIETIVEVITEAYLEDYYEIHCHPLSMVYNYDIIDMRKDTQGISVVFQEQPIPYEDWELQSQCIVIPYEYLDARTKEELLELVQEDAKEFLKRELETSKRQLEQNIATYKSIVSNIEEQLSGEKKYETLTGFNSTRV